MVTPAKIVRMASFWRTNNIQESVYAVRADGIWETDNVGPVLDVALGAKIFFAISSIYKSTNFDAKIVKVLPKELTRIISMW